MPNKKTTRIQIETHKITVIRRLIASGDQMPKGAVVDDQPEYADPLAECLAEKNPDQTVDSQSSQIKPRTLGKTAE